MTESLSAFILAAGFGERLRPITLQIPKPLLPVPEKPLLQLILEGISRLPVTETGVNLHYKRDQIEGWLVRNGYGNVRVFREDPILGTGGALQNAGDMLSRRAFLVHNADILTDLDLPGLIAAHWTSGDLVTLAVHDYARFNNLLIDHDGRLRGIVGTGNDESQLRRLAFTGVAVYDPRFLSFLPSGHSSVVDAWMAAKASGEQVGTHDVTGCYWSDIGTPGAYAAAVAHAMRREGETVFLHRTVRGCDGAEMDGLVVVGEGCDLSRKARVKNCIVLPGTDVPEGAYENCIVGQDFTVSLDEAALSGIPDAGNAPASLGAGGSDRSYSRIRTDGCSAIRLQVSQGDPDFFRQVEYTMFFRRHGVPVPALFSADMTEGTALFEDLGDLSLYAWLHCPRPADQVEGIYRRIIDILVSVHTTVTGRLAECPVLADRVFDYAYLRWETEYFLERFLKGIRNLELPASHGAREDLHRLALRVDSFAKTIVHRDMQSQNVMVTKGGIPRIIDYQGARIGPPAYDLASLLWDPYAPLDAGMRGRLLHYYAEQVARNQPGDGKEAFFSTVLPCRLQRHMQALGAYGFLSVIKRKTYFRKFIPEGIRLLKKAVTEAREDYPHLYECVISL